MQSKKQISYLYNPANQTPQEIKDNFVVRHAEFRRILRDIKNTEPDETPQNFLIVAQRGMGKTTLLLRLQYEIKNDSKLSHLIPIQLAEEQYNIFSLCNLWEAVADELDEIEAFEGISDRLQNQIESGVKDCFEVIQKTLVRNQKRIVLLVDNFGDMLDKFNDIEAKELRDILHGTHLQIVTASSRVLEETYKHDKALFEYFNLINLKGLTTQETMTLFESLAKTYQDKNTKQILQNQRSRIEIIRRLTGGVPRTMILLFEIFMDESADVFEDLELILDRVTPLYKHRMDDLSPQLQKIAHEMALAWDGVTFEEIANKTRIESAELDSSLVKLEKNDLITVTPSKGGNIYQLSERFFNIWYLMRYGRKNKKEHILWLVKFLEVWCTPKELVDRAYLHIMRVQEENINPKGAKYMTDALVCSIDNDILRYQLEIQTKRVLKKNNYDIGEEWVIENKEFSIEEKIVYYEKALEVDDRYISAYGNLGYIYNKEDDYDKAIEYYKKAIEIDDKKPTYYNSIGSVYRKQKEYDKAIELYKKAIEVDDKKPKYYNSIGSVYKNQKKYDKAIEWYTKAIEIDDKYINAYINLGDLYENQKENNKAIKYYEKAIKYYKKDIEENPKNSNLYNSLAWFYYIKNLKKEESLQLIQKSIELKKNIHNLHTYATVLLWNNQYNKSIKTIKEVLELGDYPRFTEDMTNYFLLLIAKQQIQSLDNLFKEYPNQKDKFKPVYYTLMYFMQDEYPTEYKRMGAELEETVQEMVDEVGRLGEKYGEA